MTIAGSRRLERIEVSPTRRACRSIAPGRASRVALAMALAGVLAACGSVPTAAPGPAIPRVAPEQRLAAVQAAAAGGDDRELSVQPLRDPQVEDLRATAQRQVVARNYAGAAQALNQALLILPSDPGLLQERAEVALLQSDYDRAETLARRAFDLGSKVGPLCRRHWATIEQARLARGQNEDIESARVQREACTVAGVERM